MTAPLPALHLVATSRAITYRFEVAEPLGGWACCSVNDDTGELNITSDWGNWSHRWNTAHLGCPSLTHFIGQRGDTGYLADKLMSYDARKVFDGDATLEALRERIREVRREERWNRHNPRLFADSANRLWDEDFPALCTDCDGHDAGRGADKFVEGYFKIECATAISEEPWFFICTEDAHAFLVLRDAILPALVAACAAQIDPPITAKEKTS